MAGIRKNNRGKRSRSRSSRSSSKKKNKRFLSKRRKNTLMEYLEDDSMGTITKQELQDEVANISPDGRYNWNAPVEALPRVGHKTSKGLNSDGIYSIRDLVFSDELGKREHTIPNNVKHAFKLGIDHSTKRKTTTKTDKTEGGDEMLLEHGDVIEHISQEGNGILYLLYYDEKIKIGQSSVGYNITPTRKYMKGEITAEELIKERVPADTYSELDDKFRFEY